MDDISDPDYIREVRILADALTKRYAHHPALLAVGYDNEIGNGFMSYSAADRERFNGCGVNMELSQSSTKRGQHSAGQDG